MSSKLQLDGHYHKLVVAPSGEHLQVKAGIVQFAGKTVLSMPECLRGFTSRRYVNTRYLYIYLTFT